ncbi:MAG: DUF58 domain-containing protein [Lachnospiraceae bacterium]|nr:DUF58 domain-containing protein [Lachnospiraceae bacterium]
MKSKILYGSLMVLTLAAAILFMGDTPKTLLSFEIFMIPLLFVLAEKLKTQLEGKLLIPTAFVQKQQEFPVEIHLKNKALLPMPSVFVKIYYENEFTGEISFAQETAMLDAKGEAVLLMMLKSRYCGKIRIGIEEIKVQDYLRLFSRKAMGKLFSEEIVVLPRIHKIGLNTVNFVQDRQEGQEYSHARNGEDTSEVFDVHEYRQGDTLQRIHWKLSAKTDEYFVKEYSLPMEQTILVFLDMFWDHTKKLTREDLDLFLEVLASFSWSMIEQGWRHYIIFYHEKEQRIERMSIESEKDVYFMLEQICDSRVYDREENIIDMYRSEQELEKVTTYFLLNMQGQLFRDGRLEKQFSRQELERELMEWKLEI